MRPEAQDEPSDEAGYSKPESATVLSYSEEREKELINAESKTIER